MLRPLLVVLLLVAQNVHAEMNYLNVAGAGGVPLAVATAGDPDNPPLLFIHGLGQSHFAFHEQLSSPLADDYYLVAFDLRGHGASGKPWETGAYTDSRIWAEDVSVVMEAAKIERPVVVAWSFGTLVALDYLRQTGADSIAGLVLTGATGALVPFELPTEEDPLAAEFARVRQLQMSPDPRDQVAASERMVDWLTSASLPPDTRAVMQSITMMFPAYARRAIYSRRQDNTDLLEPMAALPVLLALGGDDNAMMLKGGASLAKARRNFSLSLYEGAGHSVFLEMPRRFNAELREFAEESFGRAPGVSAGLSSAGER